MMMYDERPPLTNAEIREQLDKLSLTDVSFKEAGLKLTELIKLLNDQCKDLMRLITLTTDTIEELDKRVKRLEWFNFKLSLDDKEQK